MPDSTPPNPEARQPEEKVNRRSFLDRVRENGERIFTVGALGTAAGIYWWNHRPVEFKLTDHHPDATALQLNFEKIYDDLYQSMSVQAKEAKEKNIVPHFVLGEYYYEPEGLLLSTAAIHIAHRLGIRTLATPADPKFIKEQVEPVLAKMDAIIAKDPIWVILDSVRHYEVNEPDKRKAFLGSPRDTEIYAHTLGMKIYPGDPLHPTNEQIKEGMEKGLSPDQIALAPERGGAIIRAAKDLQKPAIHIYGANHVPPLIDEGLTPEKGWFYYDISQIPSAEQVRDIGIEGRERLLSYMRSPHIKKIHIPGEEAQDISLVAMIALVINTGAKHMEKSGEITPDELSDIYKSIGRGVKHYLDSKNRGGGGFRVSR